MLKPRYQLSLVTPPRATCANVVPKLFEKFNWKRVPAGPLLDGEAHVRDVGRVAEPRRRFGDQVHGRPHTQPSAHADDEGAVVVHELARQLVGVVDPDRLGVDRSVAPERAGNRCADRRRVAVAEVVRSLDGHRARRSSTGRPCPCLTTLMLAEKLDRPIARPVNADLRAAHDAEPVLESDLRAVVDAECVRQQVAEITLAQRTREAVRHPERARRTAASAAWSAARSSVKSGCEGSTARSASRWSGAAAGCALPAAGSGRPIARTPVAGELRAGAQRAVRVRCDDPHEGYAVNRWARRARSSGESPGSARR